MMNTGIKNKLRAAAAALCMLVILPLCVSVLPGCTGDGGDAGTSSTPATETGAGEEVNNHTEISADKSLLEQFQVVFPEKGGGVAAAGARKIIAAMM